MRNKSNIKDISVVNSRGKINKSNVKDISVANFGNKINKRGVFFSLYLVLLTLLMGGIVIGLYLIQQEDVVVSLISPLAVLEVGDDLAIFEMREMELIKGSLEDIGEELGTDAFVEEFRAAFLSGLSFDKKMTGFILEDLTWKGAAMEVGPGFDSGAFYENILYPESEMKMESGKLVFLRTKIGKVDSFRALDVVDINFPVDFSFEFERKYLISKVGNEFEVEVA